MSIEFWLILGVVVLTTLLALITSWLEGARANDLEAIQRRLGQQDRDLAHRRP